MLCETVRLTPRWRACRPFHNGNFQGSTSGEALQDYWMAGFNHSPACHFVETHRDCAGRAFPCVSLNATPAQALWTARTTTAAV